MMGEGPGSAAGGRLRRPLVVSRAAPRHNARLAVMSEPEPTELEVDPAEVAAWRTRQPDLQIVDVREPYEREAGHIEGSRHIELVELTARAGELAQDAPIVFYCRVGARSEMAAQAFRTSGFRAHSMRGGLVQWAAEERPLVPAGGRVADH